MALLLQWPAHFSIMGTGKGVRRHMEIEIKLDPNCKDAKVLIWTASQAHGQMLAQRLTSAETAPLSQLLYGARNGKIEVLEQEQLLRVYAGTGKVFAVTQQGEYVLRHRLYVLEAQLDPRRFVRISNSEIINLHKAKSFDCGLSGTICVRMADGSCSYVSRRYVSKIKKRLGI